MYSPLEKGKQKVQTLKPKLYITNSRMLLQEIHYILYISAYVILFQSLEVVRKL